MSVYRSLKVILGVLPGAEVFHYSQKTIVISRLVAKLGLDSIEIRQCISNIHVCRGHHAGVNKGVQFPQSRFKWCCIVGSSIRQRDLSTT